MTGECRTAIWLRRAGGRLVLLAGLIGLVASPIAVAREPEHGIAMHGTPALLNDFKYFPYVNPNAPRGGRLTLGIAGSFDSLNPFIVRGNAAQGLRDYLYESLLTRSLDEPFTLYGLIAERIEMPADRSEITFHLRPEARFSDGMPVTPKDVIFSHRALREKSIPSFRSHHRKVATAEIAGPHSVRFVFEAGGDREIPLIIGLMPVLPSHRFTIESFGETTLEPPVGTGPYLVARVDAGRSISYKRDPNHWGRNLPVYRGRFNVEEVRFEYFRDSSSQLEAFRAGDLDMRVEDDPTTWAEGYNFPAVKEGRVKRREFATANPAGLAALFFNTRRPRFADPRVRRAMGLLFDFEWINQNLYHGLYSRTASVFARSELSSVGRAADDRERELLGPFPALVSPEALEGKLKPPRTDGSGNNRDNQRSALSLLNAAGYTLKGDRLVDAQGAPFEFEFLAVNRGQERLMLAYARSLARLGIKVDIRQVDGAQYWSRLSTFDFDMIQWTWGSSLSPGNEQISRWGSSFADTEGARNYAGVKNPAADAMIDAMLTAGSREGFVSAVRALDRVLLSGDYVIPLFHPARQWIGFWHHLRQPERSPRAGVDLDTWWIEGPK